MFTEWDGKRKRTRFSFCFVATSNILCCLILVTSQIWWPLNKLNRKKNVKSIQKRTKYTNVYYTVCMYRIHASNDLCRRNSNAFLFNWNYKCVCCDFGVQHKQIHIESETTKLLLFAFFEFTNTETSKPMFAYVYVSVYERENAQHLSSSTSHRKIYSNVLAIAFILAYTIILSLLLFLCFCHCEPWSCALASHFLLSLLLS